MPTKKGIQYELHSLMEHIPCGMYDMIFNHNCDTPQELKRAYMIKSDEVDKIDTLGKIFEVVIAMNNNFAVNYKKTLKQLEALQNEIRSGVPKSKIMKSNTMKPHIKIDCTPRDAYDRWKYEDHNGNSAPAEGEGFGITVNSNTSNN